MLLLKFCKNYFIHVHFLLVYDVTTRDKIIIIYYIYDAFNWELSEFITILPLILNVIIFFRINIIINFFLSFLNCISLYQKSI
jgi:hypothetical protein